MLPLNLEIEFLVSPEFVDADFTDLWPEKKLDKLFADFFYPNTVSFEKIAAFCEWLRRTDFDYKPNSCLYNHKREVICYNTARDGIKGILDKFFKGKYALDGFIDLDLEREEYNAKSPGQPWFPNVSLCREFFRYFTWNAVKPFSLSEDYSERHIIRLTDHEEGN